MSLSPMNDPINEYRDDVCLKAASISCIRDDRVLFENLNFCLNNGQAMVLEGTNGSGKTSLLRIICGIRMPESGNVTWNGKPIENLGVEYHAQMAYVGHLDGIKLDLTVSENLSVFRSLGCPSEMPISLALDTVKLSEFEDIPGRALSAGQRRRLALARLLVTENRLWILDEPFTAIDQEGISLFESLIARHIDQGGLVIMSSHHHVTLDDVDVLNIRLNS